MRAGLRRQRPEAREAWLEAEMDSMQIGSSHQGKPSLRDVCRYLNLAVSEKQKWLNKQTLVKNLVEKLMSEAAHVVESASASSGSSGLSAKYMSQVRAELRRQPPETREAFFFPSFPKAMRGIPPGRCKLHGPGSTWKASQRLQRN